MDANTKAMQEKMDVNTKAMLEKMEADLDERRAEEKAIQAKTKAMQGERMGANMNAWREGTIKKRRKPLVCRGA
jgi:hypothetical protein